MPGRRIEVRVSNRAMFGPLIDLIRAIPWVEMVTTSLQNNPPTPDIVRVTTKPEALAQNEDALALSLNTFPGLEAETLNNRQPWNVV